MRVFLLFIYLLIKYYFMGRLTLQEELQRMKKLMVYKTDDYKSKIVERRSLLKEDIDPDTGGTVIINNVYQAGYYTTSAIDQVTKKTIKEQLDAELLKVTEFLKKHPNEQSIVSVKFTSQESAIPNTDNEQAGFFKSIRLDVGQLSSARKYYIDEYIKSYFSNLRKKNVISDSVQVPPVEYTFKKPVKLFKSKDIKKTPWCVAGDSQVPADDSQGYACTGGGFKVNGSTDNNWKTQKKGLYKDHYAEFVKEQNSSIEITVKVVATENESCPDSCMTKDESGNCKCPEGMTYNEETKQCECPSGEVKEDCACKRTQKEEKKDPLECAANLKIRVWVKSHNCQNAEFFIFANKKSLKNVAGGMTANLNNADSDRGIPRADSEPTFQPQFLNPGYGYLPNGDGTFNYKQGTINENGDIGKGRSDTFIVSEQDVKDIINENTNENSKSKISIWMVATTTNAHKDIPMVTITLGDEKIYDARPKIVKGKLLTIDICTKNVVEGDDDSQPDIPTLINKIVKEKSDLQNKSISTGKVRKRTQKKLDQKAVVLERSEILLDKMTSLLTYLSKNLKKGKEMSDDVYNRIKDDYSMFKEELAGNEEKNQPSFIATTDSDYGDVTFKDKTIRDNDLYGDVRIDLNKFYKGYLAVYYSPNTQETQGARNGMEKQIITAMNKPGVQQEFGYQKIT